jgi:hypothetical protein
VAVRDIRVAFVTPDKNCMLYRIFLFVCRLSSSSRRTKNMFATPIRFHATGNATPAAQSADPQTILTVTTCIYIMHLDSD